MRTVLSLVSPVSVCCDEKTPTPNQTSTDLDDNELDGRIEARRSVVHSSAGLYLRL